MPLEVVEGGHEPLDLPLAPALSNNFATYLECLGDAFSGGFGEHC